MYKVYIEDAILIFTDNEHEIHEGDLLVVAPQTRLSNAKLLQKVQITKRLCVISRDFETLFSHFCADMPLIEAGGGLTTNAQEEILMIFRNNRWDMPKGKREVGESIEACALREVEEECALQGLRLGALITHTYHCYRIQEQWVLKRTSWYKMSYDGTQLPTPQLQEGITQALFVPREEALSHLKESYYTIRDLFHAGGYEEKN